MKNYLLATTFLLLFSTASYATHTMGADWEYRCLNANGDYEITLILYRDCSGIWFCQGGCGAPCSRNVQISGASTSICNYTNFGSRELTLISVREVNPTPRCHSAKSICTQMGCVEPGTFTPGVEKYIFKGIVNLGSSSGIPQSCCRIRFSFSECCRNGSISTGSANANFYSEMMIDRCVSTPTRNSSPMHTGNLTHVLCVGQPVIIYSGSVDPELDSLSYSFVPALTGQGASVSYTPPFAFDKPMPWTGNANDSFPNGISCNPTSGDIAFTPSAGSNFVGVVALGIKEWKYNNQTKQYNLASETRRDMQIWMKQCPTNNTPFISSKPPLYPNSQKLRSEWFFYAGRENCFELIANDTNLTDTTYLSWNEALAKYGATFTPGYNPSDRRNNGPREDRYRFCWTPHDSLIKSVPYTFTLKAEDGNCPMPGRFDKTIQIYVVKEPLFNGINKTNISCNQYNFTAYITPNSGVVDHVLWTVTQTPNDPLFERETYINKNNGLLNGIQFASPGRYYINCRIGIRYPSSLINYVTMLDSIDIADSSFAFQVADTVFCQNPSILLKPQIINPFNYPLTYSWTALGNPSSVLSTTDTLRVLNSGNSRKYILRIQNNTGCTMSDTIEVTAIRKAVSPYIFGDTLVKRDFTYTYEVVNIAGATYEWVIQNGSILSGQGTYKITAAWFADGVGKLTCNEIIGGCRNDTLLLNAKINTPPPASVGELNSGSQINVFPNPTNTVLYLPLNASEIEEIKVTDLSGKVFNMPFESLEVNKVSINTRGLDDGLYMIQVLHISGIYLNARFMKTD